MTISDHQLQRDPVAFIDNLVTRNELGKPFRLMPHQREILRLAFAFDENGRLPYNTIVWSTIKKSGKTTINAAIALWWSMTKEAPNEVLILANDFEQAQGRVFKTIARLFDHNEQLTISADKQTKQIFLTNDTEITAMASEFAGAAGSNHGFTSWDELWGYDTEASMRLWEELTPVPTRENSIRFVTTYAGIEGESELLWRLYLAGVGKDEHPDGQGERIHPDLPIYANKEARLFIYWDHEPRMPWQTPAYYQSEKKSSMRAGTYLRLHENRWATAASAFITGDLWDSCVDPLFSPLLPTNEFPIFVGVDASINHDTAAVVAVRRSWPENKYVLVLHRIWRPSPDSPLDLENTIESFLSSLHKRFLVAEILCDPYQMHRSITTLQKEGLNIRSFPQTVPNTTSMGETLLQALNGKNIRLYASDELRQQALNTVAVESTRGWRIAKEKARKKIDAIAALSMACVAAIDAPPMERCEHCFQEYGEIRPAGDYAHVL